ncbi:MAG: aminotransferase class I/II-fold pyridoxal phosphate-dependent enzyme [Planctomycetes bacterium]|nr:aminotransferase class I/II-fold pyridoxal phosphate-dependent enzyme [Planctomycetota bacterium]
MADDRDVPFPYMRWAKRHLTGFTPSNLGMSGLASLTAAEFPSAPPAAYWAPEGPYGDPELRAALAAREGVPPDHVFVSAGASLANFLVYLAEARGGHVACEAPAYEALLRLPAAVSASCSTFRRDPARGWRIDPASLRTAVRPGTRLLVVTDLHNPTGVRLHADDLALLLAEAARVGAAVVVDEIYRELDTVVRPTVARTLDPRVIVTNSLTKCHGLGGLRIGWILATPDRIERVAEWNDLVCPAHPVPSIAIAKAYLREADARVARSRAEAAARGAQTDAWVRGRRDVSWTKPDGGITGFLRLPAGSDGTAFAEHALATQGVRVVPGAFFQAPDHVRISFGLREPDLVRALGALGAALDAWARR